LRRRFVNRWSSDLLEFEELREVLRRFVPSPLGQAVLDDLTPTDDRAEAEECLAETAEALAYLDRIRAAKDDGPSRLRFSGLADVRQSAEKVRIEGAVLDGVELFELAAALSRAAEARAALESTSGRLAARAARIGDLRPVLEAIEGKLLPDGTVADDASPELARLRRERSRQQRAIQESLERFVRAHKDDGVLQEDFVTQRNERFVVPVVSGQRRRVEGVIHGASGTGQTLFIEPLETIEQNNRLVRIGEDEAREVHRILREMTAALRSAGPAIPNAVAELSQLELIFGKAEFALRFDCVVPRFGEGLTRRIDLRGARHPLLADVLRAQKRTVVPLMLTLEEPVRTLLITGPNTGGKTVAMKTVGLFALMAQSGIPVPAASAELPFFREVLADIGDNQSIAESLSSFSAHVRRLQEILDAATPDSLVLLDELGRATDPEEGGALGVAVIEELQGFGGFTLASTHLLAPKVFGATTQGVLNASMGFDEETLTPTYVLRTGAPGRSAGLSIATRLGLPERILDRARRAMSSNERDIARFLDELHAKLAAARELEVEAARKIEEVRQRERDLETGWNRKESAELAELRRRSETLIADFEIRSAELLESIRAAAASKKAADQAQAAASRIVRELRQEVRGISAPSGPKAATAELQAGDRVRLEGVREAATIRRVFANDKLEVQAGLLRMQVPKSDVLEVLPPAPPSTRLPRNVSFSGGNAQAERELSIIGKTADEAREMVDRFLDRAALASLDRVRIIHGHGFGILKRAMAEFLGRHPHVERFELASSVEGGSGATIVYLRA
jgi:DNA mismatch repair protein MutS2